MPDLVADHDVLRNMADYLLESAMRAQIAGVAGPSFPLQTVFDMAQALMRVVMDLEGQGQGVPPPAPAAGPAGVGATDASTLMNGLLAGIQARTQAQIQAALEQVQKQIQQQATGTAPAQTSPTTPAPANP